MVRKQWNELHGLEDSVIAIENCFV
jgi:hypothetical protein